jgi:hypothetical protein
MNLRVGIMNLAAKVAAHLVGWVTLSVGCLAVLSTPVVGQVAPDAAKVRMQEMDKRELQLRNVGDEHHKAIDPRRALALTAQVGQDFQRILILHNKIVRSITANSTPDYQFILTTTAEIKKRASRLQSTLELQKPEPTEQDLQSPPEFNDAHIGDALIMLCKQIKSFVTNPIIEIPGTVDAQQLARARRDLENVVALSGAIKKGAERLSKIPK